MSHVDGVDDGIGYGVYGMSNTGVGVIGESKGDGFAVYGYNDDVDGKGVVGLATYSNSESTVSSYASIFDTLWIQAELKSGKKTDV